MAGRTREEERVLEKGVGSSVDDDGGDFEDDYRDFRPVSRFQSDDFGDDYSYDDLRRRRRR